MNSDSKHEQTRYLQQRINKNLDEKKNNDDIINRRQSIAHINFRKTVYRSLSLPYENDEFSNIFYIKYCLKVFLICLIILLISSLMKFLW